jgi:hypothetical protein
VHPAGEPRWRTGTARSASRRGDAPIDYKWSRSLGGSKLELDNGVRIGGFAASSTSATARIYDNGVNDSYWVDDPGAAAVVPQTIQGTPSTATSRRRCSTSRRAAARAKWGGLGTFGIENDEHKLGLTYLYTHVAEDTATLAEDTRGKEYFFPGYDPNDPTGDPGNQPKSSTRRRTSAPRR